MSTLHFVSGSSVILVAWLGATFLNEVPSQRYPKLDQKLSTAALSSGCKPTQIATVIKVSDLPRPH